MLPCNTNLLTDSYMTCLRTYAMLVYYSIAIIRSIPENLSFEVQEISGPSKAYNCTPLEAHEKPLAAPPWDILLHPLGTSCCTPLGPPTVPLIETLNCSQKSTIRDFLLFWEFNNKSGRVVKYTSDIFFR